MSNLVQRRNSLNLIRLSLAVLVIVSHTWPLGGFGGDPHLHGMKLGSLAVGAFFCISGYLIAASRSSNGAGRFLWHRVLRIMPGFWVTLLVVGLLLAPVTWGKLHGSAGGYPAGDAAGFVTQNTALVQGHPVIRGTLTNYDGLWIGALWTLPYEFVCYVVVGALGFGGWLRSRHVGIPAATALLGAVMLSHQLPVRLLNAQAAGFDSRDLLHFLLYFGAGASAFVLRDLIPNAASVAAVAALLCVAALAVMSDPIPVLCWPLAYLVLWLGAVLPSPRWVRDHDLSYGTYLYGWPIAQVLVTYHLANAGPAVLLAVTLLLTLPLAYLSLRFVEEPALRLKHWTPGALRGAVPVTVPR